MSKLPYLSIVVPAFNEEESITELVKKIDLVCTNNSFSYELIFINDGCTDKTPEIIKELSKKNTSIKMISFRRNFGKSAALSVGFKEAIGEIIITMDADLQDDPEEIVSLVNKINEGFDLVSGWKKKRHDPIDKTLPSKIFNFITSYFSGIKLHDFNCGLKAYKNVVVKTIKVYGELHRFLPVLAFWQGFKVTEIPVEHHARKYGHSKFGARRFFSGFFDLMTVLFIAKYKKKPMHLFGFFGLAFFVVGFSILAYLSTLWFIGEGIGDRPLLLFGALAVIVGVQFVGVGLLGEMITNTLQGKKQDYSIVNRIGFDDNK